MPYGPAPDELRNVSDSERLASGLGGALLLGYGLARPSLLGALSAVAGALLLERGLTGSCALYRALGMTTRSEAAPERGKSGRISIIDEIERAHEGSFPASDPPSWTPHSIGHPAAG
jgi:uncharacterized membrane protein